MPRGGWHAGPEQLLAAVVAFRPAPPSPALDGAVLLQLTSAAQARHRVRLRYHSRTAETLRGLDPYGVVCHGERWYTVGWCHLRQDVRVFRVDRVREVTTEAATFSRPAGFDSLQAVLDVIATAPWGWAVEVLLETTLEDGAAARTAGKCAAGSGGGRGRAAQQRRAARLAGDGAADGLW